MLGIASENAYVYPRIIITFQNEIPLSVDGIIQENSAQWNLKSEQFFANMKIEKIDFIGVKGYNVNDFTE
ncbi:hypothetical protein [Chryseobacterium vrystaatense]|nr:hypothetical protein [Chryseobacterium vrystaatense]